MQVNGEAIYGTTASPFKKLDWGRCTIKNGRDGAMLYLHVFDWPKNGRLLVPGLTSQVESAALLAANPRAPLETIRSAEGATILLPANAPDKISSTVAVKIKGPLKIQP